MSEQKTGSQAPRIAIKFGGGSAFSPKPSNGARKPGQAQPSSSLGKRPRPHALNQDSDSEEDDTHGKHESVTSFGANGAVNDTRKRESKSARTEAKPLVIACLANRDWKADTKGQRSGEKLLPHERENKFKGQEKEREPADQDKDIKWGLSVTKKALPSTTEEAPNSEPESTDRQKSEPRDARDENRSVDQDAIDALLGKDKGKKEKLIISGAANLTEAEALKRDYNAVGEISTIDDYEKIPDGEFGLAMLRGMGFSGNDERTKPKEVKRRTHLLGLGAKEDEEIKKAELAKKHGHRERRPRLDEYRRDKEKERQQREERHSSSYKNERDRDRVGHGHNRRHDDRDNDRHRDRDRGSHRSSKH